MGGLRICIFNKLPGDDAAAGPPCTVCSLDLDQRPSALDVLLVSPGKVPKLLMLSSSPRAMVSTGLGWVTSCSFQSLPFDCNMQPGLRRMGNEASHLTDRRELSQMRLRPSEGWGPPGEHRQRVAMHAAFLPLNAAPAFS